MTLPLIDPPTYDRPTHIDAAEWEPRVQLAACYRMFAHLGWVELIFNHITMRLPGPGQHFRIDSFGLMYSDVSASNLVRIDIEGRVIGRSDWPVNPAGFTIHAAVHRGIPDAHCLMHTHTTAGMAVACRQQGLSLGHPGSVAPGENGASWRGPSDLIGPSAMDRVGTRS